MAERWRAPGPPPVMVHGDQVTFTGQAAADLARLTQLGLERLQERAQRAGVEVPQRYLQLHLATASAAGEPGPDMRTSADVRELQTSAPWVSGRWVGVAEAARLFGVGERQARRIVEQAGGTKTSKGWRVDSGLLDAEYELRRAA